MKGKKKTSTTFYPEASKKSKKRECNSLIYYIFF